MSTGKYWYSFNGERNEVMGLKFILKFSKSGHFENISTAHINKQNVFKTSISDKTTQNLNQGNFRHLKRLSKSDKFLNKKIKFSNQITI